jgi:hypothetical protein
MVAICPLRRVVYLVGSAFTMRDFDRFGIARLHARGIEVTVLDVSAIAHPEARQDSCAVSEGLACAVKVVPDCNALADADSILVEADLAFVLFTDGTVTRHNRPILQALSRASVPFCLLCDSAQPGINNHKGEFRSLPKRIADIARRIPVIEPVNSMLARAPAALLGMRSARFAVFGGRRSQRASQLIGPATEAIFAHALDYDRFLGERDNPAPIGNTAVFIDQDLPHHRDWVLLKGHGVGDAELYYRGLNRLFERIESDLGLEVIIAAHPRALTRSGQRPFGTRRLVAGQTLDLVRRARLVMTFTSLASNFAVLAGKPLMVLATHPFYRSPAGRRYAEPLAIETGRQPLFLEDVDAWSPNDALHVDTAAYARYVENYIKVPGTPERPLWDIALNAIEAGLTKDRAAGERPRDALLMAAVSRFLTRAP